MDKCYILKSGLRIRADKKPTKEVEESLEVLFKAAYKLLEKQQVSEISLKEKRHGSSSSNSIYHR
jgi:hypothetical protein